MNLFHIYIGILKIHLLSWLQKQLNYKLNCIKNCSLEIVNEKTTGTNLLGCLPTRLSIRIRERLSCTKAKKNKDKKKRIEKLVGHPGILHEISENIEKIPTQ